MKISRFNIINFAIVIAVVCLLGVLALRVQTGATADSVAVLKTSGMTCSGCSETITSALKGAHGVAAAEVDVEQGYVIIGYEASRVTPAVLAKTVTGSGYASSVERVMPPDEFHRLAGRNVGEKYGQGQGCCGSGACGMKKKS
jgi:copper chaperone CopZ